MSVHLGKSCHVIMYGTEQSNASKRLSSRLSNTWRSRTPLTKTLVMRPPTLTGYLTAVPLSLLICADCDQGRARRADTSTWTFLLRIRDLGRGGLVSEWDERMVAGGPVASLPQSSSSSLSHPQKKRYVKSWGGCGVVEPCMSRLFVI